MLSDAYCFSSSSAFPSYVFRVHHSSSAFPNYISGARHSSSVFPSFVFEVHHSSSSSAFPSCISGVHRSSSVFPSYISGVHRSFSSSAFPTYISWVHILGWDSFRMWPFFNPTIEEVTFRIGAWVRAGCVFVVGIHSSRTWTSGSCESLRWNTCVHRLDLGLYSHLKEFFWEWSQNPC